jgi:DNA-binding transcriptional MerR regulator/effector-binding domain-containing protein
MIKNLSNYFTTGEFAKLCRINKRTLFHYDEIGLFQPAVTDENGYRYYSYRQYEVFMIISMLKELNVPLKDMKAYLDQRTPQKLLDLSKQKIEEVNQKIINLNQIKHLLEESIIFTNKGLYANCDEITIENQKEEYLVRSELLNEDNTKDYIKWMLEYNNFESRTLSKDTSFVGTMLSKENITAGNYLSSSYFFVKTSDLSRSNALKPEGTYAVACHRGSYETVGKTYDKLIDYCKKNHLRIGDFSYEESLLDIISMKEEKDYITQITIAVEKL